MSDNINDMDFEQLMAQRNQTLKSTLQENDSSEGSVDPETLALSEINYITDFFKTTGAEGLAGKLAQLRALLNGREFTTERGKEAIQKEKQKVVRSYQSTLSKSHLSYPKRYC